MRRYIFLFAIFTVLFVILVFAGGIFVGIKRGVPFVAEKEQWSIGIYRGNTPFDFDPAKNRGNPVLNSDHVTDVPAKFVADPFLIQEDDTWYMFFEVYNLNTEQGVIAVATSKNGKRWKYKQIVLDEPFHLSYPYIFKWDDDYYLIPESYENNSVRLYKADDFPYQWTYLGTILEGREFLDPSIAYYKNKWWLFASETGNDTLRLYFADDLIGPWVEHPESPIIEGDKNIARPGGRVLVYDDRIFRYTQDGEPTYGNQIWAFEITELTETIYQEQLVHQDSIVEASGSGWNADAMHNIDPVQIGENQWIASVDGFGTYLVYGWQY
jgi:hypothetical protein